MIDIARKLLGIFERREYGGLAALLVAMGITAVLQTAGVASIVPFLAVVSNPSAVTESEYLSRAYDAFGFSSTQQFLVALGLVFIGVMVLANAFAALTTWATVRMRWRSQHRISQRLLERYLRAPYSFHVTQNSSGLAKRLLGEVGRAVGEVFMPFSRLIARAISSLLIVALLVWADPVLAIIVPASIGGFYAVVYAAVRARQRRLGEEESTAKSQRFRIASEAFGGIKDLKVLGREGYFLERFERASAQYSRAHAKHEMVSIVPRFSLDALAYGGIVVVILYLLQTRDSLDEVFPLLAVYAFGANRLIPGVQEMFTSLTQIRFNAPALEELHADLHGLPGARLDRYAPPPATGSAPPAQIPVVQGIRVNDVSFAYPNAAQPALSGVSLEFTARKVSAMVGSTGSGKTTLADLLLGLFVPMSGSLVVDDQVLDEHLLPAWRETVGYVPQAIFLTDASITENIALGIPPGAIDRRAVLAAARAAHLDEFVESLPDKYDTHVGERGVRLSGGQRQRIGIARALYHGPSVLILDEATSALDTVTEDVVMQAISELAGSRTIIIIAHRLSTVRNADRIFVLESGRVAGEGTYDELLRTNDTFRALAKA